VHIPRLVFTCLSLGPPLQSPLFAFSMPSWVGDGCQTSSCFSHLRRNTLCWPRLCARHSCVQLNTRTTTRPCRVHAPFTLHFLSHGIVLTMFSNVYIIQNELLRPCCVNALDVVHTSETLPRTPHQQPSRMMHSAAGTCAYLIVLMNMRLWAGIAVML
jgi:hypothetical protein